MSLVAAAVSLLAVPLIAGLADTAQASPGSSTTAIVSMGDSFISGEAGRWAGNSLNNDGDRTLTDRAYRNGGYDPSIVYGWTATNGCHRSDVAEIQAAISVTVHENMACSGAKAVNTWRASSGGQSFKGEVPQADRLAALASSRNVKLIALSIGGNDLGFSDIISSCVTGFIANGSPCRAAQQSVVDARMPAAMANVSKTVDEIRSVMAGAGYSTSDYRLVLQSYPSPVPRASENRYTESGQTRTVMGCPMWDTDLNWARDSLVPRISAELKKVAVNKNIDFLDLKDAFQGKEVCSKFSSLVDATHLPSSKTSEWVRFVNSGAFQGDQAESLHPNAYGQKALGACLSAFNLMPRGRYACTNNANGSMLVNPAP
ncbi:GDSL-type esterase/lipase family protein [Streptomyces sp. NPDC048514]|uniref:GDSL-type esterase/lipase family protein n=1 Tax=Streptomyces sp. NPDC048514 TaxID=3365564 RepID=UPI0037226B2E